MASGSQSLQLGEAGGRIPFILCFTLCSLNLVPCTLSLLFFCLQPLTSSLQRPKAHIFLTSQLLTFSLFCLQPQTYIREANVRVGLWLTISYFKSLFIAQKGTPVPAGHHFIHGFQMVLTRKGDLPGTLTY
jgi:hypothetical protein